MDVVNVVVRGARRIRRDLRKYARLRTARREGLVYVAPNFLYRPELTPASVVIDAGCSYEADFSVCLMQRHGVRAFGVDPTRKHQGALRTLEARSGGRFVHVPCALAAADGVVTFHESRTNESGSLLPDHVNVIQDQTTSYDVEAVTVRSLLARLGLETVDILKLDLEGAEYALLTDIDAAELRAVRQLFVEFHHHAVSHVREADSRSLVRRISGFGFRAVSLDDYNYLFYRDR